MAIASTRCACCGASIHTARLNNAWYQRLDFDDKSEEQCAIRGLIEMPESVVIKNEQGEEVWNVDEYSFVKELEKAPDTVNPSLWRHTLYNSYAGLFEVCDGIYQVRGYDMANATFIRTDHGWIVFDVLMCTQDMAAAKALMEKHFGPISLKAVLYSHSHVDHYGGILGLMKREEAADPALPLAEQLASGKVPVLAPEGFLKYAVSENVYAGPAMARRAQYQYGTHLKPGAKGRMAIGIGLGQSLGNTGLIAPTYEIKTNETLVIDGLEIRFQLTPGTEAPAEMHAFFPGYHGLWLAENCTGTMHNLYTLRGAQVRNADDWAAYILEAKQLFGKETEVIFQSHNWPHWGRQECLAYMENTAAVYQFIHDQTLHYINLGYTAPEISRTLQLPDALDKIWYTRQYYGTLSHNIKAVYQKYMGWYDANPVNLNPLTPVETAKKWAEYLPDRAALIAKVRADLEKGEYQWVAQITKELVFADPTDREARELCADALEQLGYQAESGPWRNVYLTGSIELRCGNQADITKSAAGGPDVRKAMTARMMLSFIAISTDALSAQHDDLSLALTITDTAETFFLKRRAGVLLCYPGSADETPDASLALPKERLLGMMLGIPHALDGIRIDGDASVPGRLLKYMTRFTPNFNITEP